MKCVHVCVSVCLFRYVGIVSCRYIKETHGMKDDDNDNDNDREKNGNFGNSFHFRQIHTHRWTNSISSDEIFQRSMVQSSIDDGID